MKHLSEEELLELQMNETLSDDLQTHFDACLFCQAELKKEKDFAIKFNKSIRIKEDSTLDIRQKVFNELDIDFKVENKKDYFSEISLSFFIVSVSILLYLLTEMTPLLVPKIWIPLLNLPLVEN